ncbi:MAG: hypothetical protein DWQ36_15740 [Acidobacteria bacterium]|nr:MAG: hypothetical protein DWQ30_01435 [Acidobacteriota bacterium]REK05953.1 MAG: hypothetical protein DWQ36_15740 [Acidobacteriota bacterium]
MSDKPTPNPVLPGLSFLERLRFPQLFLILAAIFLADLALPDLIPLVDEIVLGLLTLMLGVWRRRGDELGAQMPRKEPEKNVTPP